MRLSFRFSISEARIRRAVLPSLLIGLALPFNAPSQSARTPVDVFSQTGFGRRSEMFRFDESQQSLQPGPDPTGAFDKILDILLNRSGAPAPPAAYVQVVLDYVPVSAIDIIQKKTFDYFCVGSDISINVPRGWSFNDFSIRFWTDYDVNDLQALNVVPLSTTGSWSTSDTTSWSVDGSVGMFGLTPTLNIGGGVSFSNSRSVTVPGLLVTNHKGAISKNDPGWSFSAPSNDSSLPIRATNSPTWEFYLQYLLRASSAAARPRIEESYGNSVLAPDRRRRLPITMTKDGLPGLKIHFQGTLTLDRGVRRVWKTPVEDFVIPFAPLARLSAPSKGKLGVYSDGGQYFDFQKQGRLFALIQTAETDPAIWLTRDGIQNQYLNTGKHLKMANDWVTPGEIVTVDDNGFLQATVQMSDPITPAGAKTVRAIRLKYAAQTASPGDDDSYPPDYRLVPTSVLFDLLMTGANPPNLRKATMDWLHKTGWSFTYWSSDLPVWRQTISDR